MTKRIFAIVLALVMSLSMFAVEAFAAGATATLNGNNVTITCTEAGAAKYVVDLFKDGASYAGVKEIAGSTLSATFNNLPAGAYFAYVRPYDANGTSLVTEAYKTNAVNITTGAGTTTGVIYQAYYGPYCVTKFADKATVTWNHVQGAAQYRVTYVINGVQKQAITGSPVVEIPAKVTDAFSIEVSAFSTNASLGSLGTQNILAGNTGGSSTGTGTGSGNVSTTGNLVVTKSTTSAKVSWTAVSNATGYLVEYKKLNAATSTSNFVTTSYVTVPFGVNDTWSIVVKAVVNGNLITVGSATVTAGSSTGTGSSGIITSGNLSVTKGATSSIIKWNAIPAATGYIVYYKKSGETTANTTYANVTQATIPYGTNDSWIVEVKAVVNSNLVSVGSATVTPGSTTNGTVSGTVTTTGANCTVISSYNSSTVTWNATGSTFLVIYTETGKEAKSTTVTTKSITIPVGYNTSFTVYIYNMSTGSLCANATVKANANTGSSTTVTKTDIKNLTLTYSGGWNTVVTWDKIDGAQFYQVDHALLGANAGETEVNTKNTITLPYGKNINFQVIVTAFMKDGTKKTVGYAYHVAGTTAGSTTTTPETPDVEVAEEFDTVTGFWGETMGKGVVKLTWNAVEDCDTYKVYYRKVGATKWSGGHSRSKTYISIDFGSKTSTYEFKIVAGDEESTVLTLKPSATKGTVAWAMNHDSDAKFETNLAGVVKDADNGKITLTWDEVDGVKYTVYYRKAGTTTWKGAYERNGESITITFKASNIDDAYEVMVKAGKNESDIFTIKPAVWTNAD